MITTEFSFLFLFKPWVVTFEEKTKSDIMFHQTDTDKDGYVTGLECKDIFLNSGLSQIILANIWYTLIFKNLLLFVYKKLKLSISN